MKTDNKLKIQLLALFTVLFVMVFDGNFWESVGMALGSITASSIPLYIFYKVRGIKLDGKDLRLWRNLLIVSILWTILTNWNGWYNSFMAGYERGYTRMR